jgi:hypothetical protein
LGGKWWTIRPSTANLAGPGPRMGHSLSKQRAGSKPTVPFRQRGYAVSVPYGGILNKSDLASQEKSVRGLPNFRNRVTTQKTK